MAYRRRWIVVLYSEIDGDRYLSAWGETAEISLARKFDAESKALEALESEQEEFPFAFVQPVRIQEI